MGRPVVGRPTPFGYVFLGLIFDLVENPLQVSDRHAVVGHRDVLGAGLGDAAQYVAPVEHTGAAVDYQVVGREVGGKVRAGQPHRPAVRVRSVCGASPEF